MTGGRARGEGSPAFGEDQPQARMSLFAIPYPIARPVAIPVGPVAVRWYGIAYMAGILCGWLYGRYLVSRPPLGRQVAHDGEPRPTISCFGSRSASWSAAGSASCCFTSRAISGRTPSQIPAVWQGGMSFHGGLHRHRGCRVSLLAPQGHQSAVAWRRRLRRDAVRAVLRRIANFINSEVVGRESDVPGPWSFPAPATYPRHPSQLYEAALEGIVLFIILRIATHPLSSR